MGAVPAGPVFDYALFNAAIELQAFVFDGTDSTTVGNNTSVTTLNTADRACVTGMTADRVAICGSDGFNNFRLGMYEFDGTDWALVGNEFQVNGNGNFAFPSMAALDATTVALGNVLDLNAYEFDGTDWATTGNTLIAANALDMDSISNTRFIALRSNGLEIFDWDGTDFTSFAVLNVGHADRSIATLDATHYAVYDQINDELKTFDLVGTTIAQDGNALSIPSQTFTSICALSPTRIILGSNTDDTLQAYDWDGVDWTSQGNSLFGEGVPERNNLAQCSALLI